MHLRAVIFVLLYGLTNLTSAVLIVVANKVVLGVCQFKFPVCLTWMHTVVTVLGMNLMALGGMFERKQLDWRAIAPNACAYVGYVVFNNISIQVNTISFYQISKICVTPTVVLVEFILYGKRISRQQVTAVVILMLGIAIATVSDAQVSGNLIGVMIAVAAVSSTALCQVWAGAKQKELHANGNQLLHSIAPIAAVLLGVLVPLLEPVGRLPAPQPDTILGYQYSPSALAWIGLSSVLGLVVTLSSYMFIAATSPLTFNVLGHLKTVLIVACGMLVFGDALTARKLTGLACAMIGIVWYSADGVQRSQAAAAAAAAATSCAAHGSTSGNALATSMSENQLLLDEHSRCRAGQATDVAPEHLVAPGNQLPAHDKESV